MLVRPIITALMLGGLALAGCTSSGTHSTVRVAAASSTAELWDRVEAELVAAGTDVELVVDLGGSSTLARQILDGAPVDVFLAADEATMDAVADAGLIRGRPSVIATNRLVLAVPTGNPGGVRSLDALARSDVTPGLCAPEVPCGRLARAELAESGVIARAPTEEPDARTLLAKLAAGELTVALVYRTDVAAAGGSVEIVPDHRLDRSNAYEIAVVVGAGPLADAVVAAVSGPVGRAILADLGFGPP